MLPVSGAQLCVSCAFFLCVEFTEFLKHEELAFSYWTESWSQKCLSKFSFSQKCCSLIYAFLLHEATPMPRCFEGGPRLKSLHALKSLYVQTELGLVASVLSQLS